MQFKIIAPGKTARFLTLMLFGILPLMLAAWSFTVSADYPLAWKIALPVAFIIALIGLSSRRRSVSIDDRHLTVKASLYTHQVPLHDLVPDNARVIDLQEEPGEKPKSRTNGYSLPGFQAGYFRGRGRQKMFCLITAPTVLKLPLQDQSVLLLSLEQPSRLMARLERLTV